MTIKQRVIWGPVNIQIIIRKWLYQKRRRDLPVVKRTMAFRQLYSAASTWRALSFSTCSWNIRIWSMKATTRSAAIGDACSPAAANKGATCRGIEHWDAFNTNSSLQTSLNKATWSVTCVACENDYSTKLFLSQSKVFCLFRNERKLSLRLVECNESTIRMTMFQPFWCQAREILWDPTHIINVILTTYYLGIPSDLGTDHIQSWHRTKNTKNVTKEEVLTIFFFKNRVHLPVGRGRRVCSGPTRRRWTTAWRQAHRYCLCPWYCWVAYTVRTSTSGMVRLATTTIYRMTGMSDRSSRRQRPRLQPHRRWSGTTDPAIPSVREVDWLELDLFAPLQKHETLL